LLKHLFKIINFGIPIIKYYRRIFRTLNPTNISKAGQISNMPKTSM